MSSPEQLLPINGGGQLPKEVLNPRHFYATYVFDNTSTRRQDISILIHEAQQLGYPVRNWWLSEATELQGSPDRLIVCVHHLSLGEDAGMDLFNVLSEAGQKHRVQWDRLEAAHDDAGPLYVRREWPSGKFGLVEMQVPDDFTPHGWGPAYVHVSRDTLEEVLAHLDQLVEDGILTSEEHARQKAAVIAPKPARHPNKTLLRSMPVIHPLLA